MTIKQSLVWANKKLKPLRRADYYDTPTLDAEILLAFTLKKPKEFLYAHPEKKLTAGQFLKFKKLVARRAKHEPIAYITGHKFFYGLNFYVDRNVPIPRPETELLAEETIKKIQNTKYKIQDALIVDVGAGSGAIAITLARHLPGAKIFAAEISPDALAVARKNARRHGVAITFLRGNLLQPLIEKLDSQSSNFKSLIVVANLPYLTTKQWQCAQPEIKKYEPRTALAGGKDGLKYYKKLLKQIKLLITNYKLPITSIFEIDPSQTESITKLIRAHFPAARPEIKKDLAGRDRIVISDI